MNQEEKQRLINKHRKERTKSEQRNTKWLKDWLNKYRPNLNYTIRDEEDEWCHNDTILTIKNKDYLIEHKSRTFDINKYDTLALSTGKLYDNPNGKAADIFFLWYPVSKKVAVITRKKILKNLDKIKTEKRTVTTYYWAPELGQNEEDLLFLPKDLVTIYDHNFFI